MSIDTQKRSFTYTSAQNSIERRRSTGTKALLACGAGSTLFYFGMDAVAALLYDGYSYTDQTISELSAIGAPTRSLWVPLRLRLRLARDRVRVRNMGVRGSAASSACGRPAGCGNRSRRPHCVAVGANASARGPRRGRSNVQRYLAPSTRRGEHIPLHTHDRRRDYGAWKGVRLY